MCIISYYFRPLYYSLSVIYVIGVKNRQLAADFDAIICCYTSSEAGILLQGEALY